MDYIRAIERQQIREDIPQVRVADNVKVHCTGKSYGFSHSGRLLHTRSYRVFGNGGCRGLVVGPV